LTKGLIDVTAIVLCTVIQVLVSRFLFFSWHKWWWIADSLWKMDLRVKKALFFCFYPMIIFGSFGLFLFLIVFLVVFRYEVLYCGRLFCKHHHPSTR